ncbi:Gmad2 immunoglobulin-like domain-containing protein [Confluentibacter flavum]|uniref:Sporulation protein n=1 Tax=Confluentibacter flavum TaxID=1909700 RepID=A0A2N3HKV8_9FLAO|nr:Gmad2 immunoglobulin-like domain-containing protein [Confluentibacter flavum]PKQ45605.1 sporulation protein [Confluentibacter flavum]
MKRIILLLIILFAACNKKDKIVREAQENVKTSDTVQLKKAAPSNTTVKKYSNERFRNVTVEKVNNDKFRVKGEGQIFEASFNWTVEDGHDELKKGYEMTDAGAPEWGKFDFTVDVAKNRENSTLTLILFEISAKDGSRQHELPIVLF